MTRSGIAALAAAVIAAGAAGAAPIDDVGPWIARFQAQAGADQFDAMAAEAKAIASPKFTAASIDALFGDLAKTLDGNHADSAEPFEERKLGGVMRRVGIAVHYPRGYVFYALTFVHEPGGWQLLQIAWNGDVNKVLEQKWP